MLRPSCRALVIPDTMRMVAKIIRAPGFVLSKVMGSRPSYRGRGRVYLTEEEEE
jgi:hypothetical protein